tara:strand:- start:317 stop:1291 length:975 start_codon:yes stop_codon:yes gene_type:complete
MNQKPQSDDGLDHLDIENFALSIAKEAGKILFHYFPTPWSYNQNLNIEFKDSSNSDPVTLADTETQDYLVKQIEKHFPSHGILGEEGDKNEGECPDVLWVLDPLDGTKNFLNGLPSFACSVGVIHKGIPVAGALFIPWPGRGNESGGIVIHASRGNGVKIDGIKTKHKSLSNLKPSGLLTLPGSFSGRFENSKDFPTRMGELRMSGSIAYELAMVALGITQYAVISGAHLWDVAAALVILEESGCSVRTPKSLSIGERLLPGDDVWEELSDSINVAPLEKVTYSKLRRPLASLLVASDSIMPDVSGSVRPKNIGFRGVARSIFG